MTRSNAIKRKDLETTRKPLSMSKWHIDFKSSMAILQSPAFSAVRMASMAAMAYMAAACHGFFEVLSQRKLSTVNSSERCVPCCLDCMRRLMETISIGPSSHLVLVAYWDANHHGYKPCRKFMVHLHRLDGQEVFTGAVNLDQPERFMSELGVQNVNEILSHWYQSQCIF